MLDAWIIEELRKRELEKEEQERPFLELPIADPKEYKEKIKEKIKEKSKRGVIIIQL